MFRHLHEVERAYEDGDIALHATITLRGPATRNEGERASSSDLETTAGRLFFNETLPPEVEYVNERVDKRVMGRIVDQLANESAKGTRGHLPRRHQEPLLPVRRASRASPSRSTT